MVKQVNDLLNTIKALQALVGLIRVRDGYVEVVLPENVVITADKHIAIRTPNGKLMLNPRIPDGRTLDEHIALIKKEHRELLEKQIALIQRGTSGTVSGSFGNDSYGTKEVE